MFFTTPTDVPLVWACNGRSGGKVWFAATCEVESGLCKFRTWWNTDCSQQISAGHHARGPSTGQPQPLLAEPPQPQYHPQAQPPHKKLLLICGKRGGCAEGSALCELTCTVMSGHSMKHQGLIHVDAGVWELGQALGRDQCTC